MVVSNWLAITSFFSGIAKIKFPLVIGKGRTHDPPSQTRLLEWTTL